MLPCPLLCRCCVLGAWQLVLWGRVAHAAENITEINSARLSAHPPGTNGMTAPSKGRRCNPGRGFDTPVSRRYGGTYRMLAPPSSAQATTRCTTESGAPPLPEPALARSLAPFRLSTLLR